MVLKFIPDGWTISKLRQGSNLNAFEQGAFCYSSRGVDPSLVLNLSLSLNLVFVAGYSKSDYSSGYSKMPRCKAPAALFTCRLGRQF
jgi:hypothetical protein